MRKRTSWSDLAPNRATSSAGAKHKLCKTAMSLGRRVKNEKPNRKSRKAIGIEICLRSFISFFFLRPKKGRMFDVVNGLRVIFHWIELNLSLRPVQWMGSSKRETEKWTIENIVKKFVGLEPETVNCLVKVQSLVSRWVLIKTSRFTGVLRRLLIVRREPNEEIKNSLRLGSASGLLIRLFCP